MTYGNKSKTWNPTNMVNKTNNQLSKLQKRLVVYLSLVVLLLDIAFVSINYATSKATLNENLLKNAKIQEREFHLAVEMSYRNMMQLAIYISNDKSLNQLFLKGKKAVIAEGGLKGGKKASEARQALLKKVQPAWNKMTEEYNIRQLHYHIGPGSLSFLRVHKPQKYGDRLDNLRHIIVDTNREKIPRSGFETGRIYSGLRGVQPIWAIDPQSNRSVFVGALETGTSFKQLLPIFARSLDTNIAILLSKNHVESKMWPEFIKAYFNKNPGIKYYIEASSSDNIKNVLKKIKVDPSFTSKKVELLKMNNKTWSVYYFPLNDYLNSKNGSKAPSGFVLFWSDQTQSLKEFERNIWVNIIFALLALILIKLAMVFLLHRHNHMRAIEKLTTLDGLTGVKNRAFFEHQYEHLKTQCSSKQLPTSCIMIDIDNFKAINDKYGHQTGDQCIIEVAQTLKSELKRKNDWVARYGGEEFVLLLTNTSHHEACKMAERMRKSVSEIKVAFKQTPIQIRISAGVQTATDIDELASLVKKADEKLYQAKSGGRNQVCSD